MGMNDTKRPTISFTQAMADPALFGPWFADPSWANWRIAAAALFGEPMLPSQAETFARFTGRSTPPTAPVREGWFVCGRRGGKSILSSAVAAYLAAFHNYRRFLKPGERAVVQVVAGDRNQARVCFSYIAAMFDQIPLLTPMIASRTAESLTLTNGICIEVIPARSGRSGAEPWLRVSSMRRPLGTPRTAGTRTTKSLPPSALPWSRSPPACSW